ncbi:hypothetical protein HDU98_009572 [Podochytrium sp. JEL0797]|nr:hypothetical protein HDU98_009572 [Podochytrium sp. JEL0797]
MELIMDVPRWIRGKRGIDKALADAFAESDDHRGTRFRLFRLDGKESKDNPEPRCLAIITVPREAAGLFLISAGKWGRILVGMTELFPKRSRNRPDTNAIKALLDFRLPPKQTKTPSDAAIQHLLTDLHIPDEDDEDEDSDESEATAWLKANKWTSNLNLESDFEKVEEISIPVQEAYFGVWCDNEATEHVVPVASKAHGPNATLLPNAQNAGFSEFKILSPQERGNPTFSPEWKASQIVGMNSFDHPFFEIDGDTFKLKLSADVQIRFFEFDIKSVVLHHTAKESNIFITLAHPPVIIDTSETTTASFADLHKAKFSRIYQVNPKHAFFVFNCLVCRITFHTCRTDTISKIFSRVGPSVQCPVLIAPGGLYSSNHQKKLTTLFTSLPIRIAYQLALIQSWGLMFPNELLAFVRAAIVPLVSKQSEAEIAQLLSLFVRSTHWEPFKGESRPNYPKLFEEIKATFQYIPEDFDSAKYCMAYQLYVTPTGMYIDGPFLEKSNRVMRQYKEFSSNFLQVNFVEEDGSQFNRSSIKDVAQDVIYKDRIAAFLKKGLSVAGREFKFLAFSNSSLKEGRVLFFHEPVSGSVTVDSIRAWMGDFSMIKSPARYAARMGQAFTSTASTLTVAKEEIYTVADVERNGYIFSDGVGTVSPEIAGKIWEMMKKMKEKNGVGSTWRTGEKEVLDVVPSAFQIRFGGAKGMVSVDPTLTGRKLKIRRSMIKFRAPNSKVIEIADDAGVCRQAYFNRQVILILEDLGISKQTFLDLQRNAVRELAFMWDSPEEMIALASREGAFGNAVRLWNNLGLFEWPENDFIRQSFEHIRSYLLKEIKYRARFLIPGGWTLFGVLDETGTLKEGQIFVQVSSPEETKIITGPVIIYRSPALHPGDIQPVVAVDNPHLHHMRNVIVFSQHGSRDLPSKLAGGDLDGDQFTIISNRELLPDRSAFRAAAAYTPLKPPVEMNRSVTMDDVAEFIVYFMQHDKLGLLSKRHMALADQVDGGTKHPDCLVLAELCNHAVDFPKTGVPADITNAPKKKHVLPDFMYKTRDENWKTDYYKSPRAMGLMFRDEELNELIEQTYRSGGEGRGGYRSPDRDPVWRFVKTRCGDWEAQVNAAVGFQATFENEVERIASFCRPKLTERELGTGYINMDGRKSHRSWFNMEEWVRDQFGALLIKTEKLMVAKRSEVEVCDLAAASYYVSNVVKGKEGVGSVFGFVLFHFFA